MEDDFAEGIPVYAFDRLTRQRVVAIRSRNRVLYVMCGGVVHMSVSLFMADFELGTRVPRCAYTLFYGT